MNYSILAQLSSYYFILTSFNQLFLIRFDTLCISLLMPMLSNSSYLTYYSCVTDASATPELILLRALLGAWLTSFCVCHTSWIHELDVDNILDSIQGDFFVIPTLVLMCKYILYKLDTLFVNRTVQWNNI